MKYFLALLLPSDISNKVSSYQNLAGYYRVPPHITIGPNSFNSDSIKELTSVLNNIIRSYPPLPIITLGINKVRMGKQSVLFLEVKNADSLDSLNREVSRKIDPSYLEEFHPHITISKNLPEQIEEFSKTISGYLGEERFTIDSVGLFEETSQGPWKLAKIFKFQD